MRYSTARTPWQFMAPLTVVILSHSLCLFSPPPSLSLVSLLRLHLVGGTGYSTWVRHGRRLSLSSPSRSLCKLDHSATSGTQCMDYPPTLTHTDRGDKATSFAWANHSLRPVCCLLGTPRCCCLLLALVLVRLPGSSLSAGWPCFWRSRCVASLWRSASLWVPLESSTPTTHSTPTRLFHASSRTSERKA